eukprot:1160594-Pelagomonas_calceolata.AAC.1
MLASCSSDKTVRIWSQDPAAASTQGDGDITKPAQEGEVQQLQGSGHGFAGKAASCWHCSAVLEDAHSRTIRREECWECTCSKSSLLAPVTEEVPDLLHRSLLSLHRLCPWWLLTPSRLSRGCPDVLVEHVFIPASLHACAHSYMSNNNNKMSHSCFASCLYALMQRGAGFRRNGIRPASASFDAISSDK